MKFKSRRHKFQTITNRRPFKRNNSRSRQRITRTTRRLISHVSTKQSINRLSINRSRIKTTIINRLSHNTINTHSTHRLVTRNLRSTFRIRNSSHLILSRRSTTTSNPTRLIRNSLSRLLNFILLSLRSLNSLIVTRLLSHTRRRHLTQINNRTTRVTLHHHLTNQLIITFSQLPQTLPSNIRNTRRTSPHILTVRRQTVNRSNLRHNNHMVISNNLTTNRHPYMATRVKRLPTSKLNGVDDKRRGLSGLNPFKGFRRPLAINRHTRGVSKVGRGVAVEQRRHGHTTVRGRVSRGLQGICRRRDSRSIPSQFLSLLRHLHRRR